MASMKSQGLMQELHLEVPKPWLVLIVLAVLVWSGDSMCTLEECEQCGPGEAEDACACAMSETCREYWKQRHSVLGMEHWQWQWEEFK
ncbi:hypothetical protein PoB_003528300 [Plakobranchus ocellatus]|uniref:Uncharacterized protein n=1 Tax=Plakobranchus ocellatus TaxID=259542 RepID=A0AAV4APP6_9GAST|nr:hypothetical protein PoB_003528300 [Plakobranchus ocellatus]